MMTPLVAVLAFIIFQSDTVSAIDSEVILKQKTSDWKHIIGDFGNVFARLHKRDYDTEKVLQFGRAAIPAGEKCYEEKMKDHPKKKEIYQIIKTDLATFPEGNWSDKLVEDVKRALQEVNQDPRSVVKAMTNVFSSMICWREDMEKRMRQEDNDWYECLNHEYQGIIRKWDGPCVEDPEALFWKRCTPRNTVIDCTLYQSHFKH